ncbi:MAG: hypothetical protein KKA10_14890 [Euryarchaeota archaeon]|nr:hypothetical protein [Euryarchaeota archaeon]MCG2737863.1 hypothetical protein [Candidatus Methanoperedenaceae archaeon]
MVKLKKRGEKKEEPYDLKKLEASLHKAGASATVAKKVINSVKVHEGMSTQELRKYVIDHLQKLDPKIAEAYSAYKKPTEKAKPTEKPKPTEPKK